MWILDIMKFSNINNMESIFPKGHYEKLGYEVFLEYENFQEEYKILLGQFEFGLHPFEISFLLGLIKYYEFERK
jgi:hypothetical protein